MGRAWRISPSADGVTPAPGPTSGVSGANELPHQDFPEGGRLRLDRHLAPAPVGREVALDALRRSRHHARRGAQPDEVEDALASGVAEVSRVRVVPERLADETGAAVGKAIDLGC